MTTSIPEAPGSGPHWDYRYCWLRDAYYALGAFRLLGHFEEREQFVHYLLNIAAAAPDLELAPLYRVDGSVRSRGAHPRPTGRGFEGERPVRVGNAAALHKQHDIFGEMVLALAPLFLDDRFRRAGDAAGARSGRRGSRARPSPSPARPTPASGSTAPSGGRRPSRALMCWAAADRMARIAARHIAGAAPEFADAAARIREEILAKAVRPRARLPGGRLRRP